jgi:hypothetical protein
MLTNVTDLVQFEQRMLKRSNFCKYYTIKAIFGEDGGDKILQFIRNHLIPQEQSYCFYLRKGVRNSRQPQTPTMKVQIMLSKPVLPVCFRSMVLTNLSKFKLTPIPTNLTSSNNIWQVHCLEEQRGETLPPSMM